MHIKKIGSIVAAGLISLSLLSACGNATTDESSDAQGKQTSELSGQLTASGSSALQPLAKEAADEFMAQHPNVVLSINGGGSGEGLKQVAAGSVNIGNSDVFAEEKLDAQAAKDLVDHQVAITVMAPVVNKELGIKDLTKAQLVDIFTGKTTNWSEVGGPNEKIMLVTRPSSSGTRALFQKYALDGAEEASNQALETDDSGTLLQSVKENKGAIGYVALSYLVNSDEVQAVAIDGVEPTLEEAYAGTYSVWGYEHMYTKGDPDPLAKAFIDFMMSDEFAAHIEKLGYGPTSKLTDEAKATHDK